MPACGLNSLRLLFNGRPEFSPMLPSLRAGEALLTLAAAYPKSTFHGYDIAQKSLDCAASRRVAASPLQFLLSG